MQLKKLAITTLLTSSALLIGASASAAQVDSSFKVKLAITSLCTINTINDVDFGQVDGNTATQTKSTQLNIRCNDTKPYTVALKPSNNNASGQGAMKASSGPDTIAYNLYQDAAGTVPWGTGSHMVSHTGNGNVQSIPVHVKVLGSEFEKPADHYSDVVAVAVHY